MYFHIGKPRSINSLVPRTQMVTLPRDRFNILVIDDQPFPYYDLLRQNHFNLHKQDDITDIHSVSAYPIVMCDIRGVGAKLSAKFEGAHVIAEIRRHYPHIVVIAYTGQQFDTSYNKFLQHADFQMKKDADLDDWISTLDRAISMSNDPAKMWCRTRDKLIDLNVPVFEVALLEDQYVGFVESSKPSFPDDKLSSSLNPEARQLLVTVRDIVKILPKPGD